MHNKNENPLRYLFLPNLLDIFKTERTREILSVNPTIITTRDDAKEVIITAYVYDKTSVEELKGLSITQVLALKQPSKIVWINIDGLRKADVETVGEAFGIHPLLREDILTINQRPKMEDVDDILFSVMSMLYYNEKEQVVEQEQISLVLGKNFVITFQEDPSRDVFNSLRDRLKLPTSKTRTKEVDYLYYTLIDTIVDHYFIVMDKLGDRIEDLEEQVIRSSNKRALAQISLLRKELIVLKRNIYPVRELISNIINSDSELLNEINVRYYRDVYDHSIQSIDLVDNYRDITMGLQDLYINNVSLKTNEVMKVMAIVTSLLAPATVIGGIFGMNFGEIPLLHNQWGFWIAVAAMLLIPIWMLSIFKKKGWF